MPHRRRHLFGMGLILVGWISFAPLPVGAQTNDEVNKRSKYCDSRFQQLKLLESVPHGRLAVVPSGPGRLVVSKYSTSTSGKSPTPYGINPASWVRSSAARRTSARRSELGHGAWWTAPRPWPRFPPPQRRCAPRVPRLSDQSRSGREVRLKSWAPNRSSRRLTARETIAVERASSLAAPVRVP